MILIVSEIGDNVTDTVISYLKQKQINIYRINPTDAVTDITFDNFDNGVGYYCIYVENKGKIQSSCISYIWYRRGYISMPSFMISGSHSDIEDWNTVINHILLNSKSNGILGSFFNEHIQNKLADLELARKAGFKVPQTLVTTRKSDLINFGIEKKIIAKGINTGSERYYELFKTDGTVLLDNIMALPDTLPLCLFQHYIEKEIELRIFYMCGIIYTAAIFSQDNDKTRIDYRQNDPDNPNRVVPFLLPAEVEEQLCSFMVMKNLNTGSIDMILTPDFEFIFLEVNPSGHFEWISQACNFGIEKSIAEHLAI